MKVFQKYSPIITILLVIIIWQLCAVIVDATLIFPTPYETLKEMLNVFSKKVFYLSIMSSILRTVLSFGITFALAIILALISVLSKTFEKLLYPIILIVRATPTMSVIFLCLIWFSSNISPMIVATMVILPTLYASILSAIKSIDKNLIEMSNVYKVPTKTRIKKLYLPYVTEKVYIESVSAISLNVKLIIAAEALAQTSKSLGVLMQVAKSNLDTATLFAYTVSAILVSYFMELLLKFIHYLYRRNSNAKFI